ncbi:hypothetical protein [Saccharothrix sp.]|uniref:hypothetical protein n=1 Tax=Saccharothrix sp. TaxID=1873460 RepID=UPI002811950E|nr:hypothetical protein [Saccharothrix sp.]
MPAKWNSHSVRTLVKLLGREQVAAERIARLAKARAPQFIGGSGDIAQQLLSTMPIAGARELMMAALTRTRRDRAVEE